ncbi:MAG: bifunctional precorrin-2 dehydrogenase/sirohydrochlorin ferrochelatase [Deltaproteobacteria bacterium]|nr:MAG: bifunctional precorrin-2 dehydrogenase/sirohydrochlorin ferrochelatase [Deltaproteobacteria bacterium]
MRYYPVYLDIQNRKCLVVGGGSVGTRKVKTLLKCGAKVTVISPNVSAQLKELAKVGSVTLIQRSYHSADLDEMFLVIGATDDAKLNRQISSDAERLNMLCNIADRPQDCNFILPSIINRGDLIISISTSGKSPALAKKLRKRLEGQFGEEYAVFLQLMGEIRKKLLSQAHEPEAHKQIFKQLINKGLVEMIRENKTADINSLLYRILGEGYEYEHLLKRGHQ